MSFGAGFVEGFANTLSTGMLERQKEARDYFNKQVEYARTTGLENRKKVKASADANLTIARQLEDVNVPKDLIMAQINQNPAGLTSLFDQVEQFRADSKRDLSAEEWRDIFRVTGDFKAPDEDLATFIARTYDPISNAIKDEAFQDDPKGTLMASLLGFDQMDRARAGLANTEIAEGLTAEQLIRYGDVEPQRRGGSAVVTIDYSAIPGKPAKPGDKGGLGIPQILPVTNAVDEDMNLRIGRIQDELGTEIPPERLLQLREEAADDYYELYGGRVEREEFLPMIDRAFKARGLMPTTGSESLPTEAVAPSGTMTSPEPQTPVVEAPMASGDDAPITPETDPDLLTLNLAGGEVLVWIKDNGDGTSDYQEAKSGVTVTYPNSVIRESF